jgi:hypothetical protein
VAVNYLSTANQSYISQEVRRNIAKRYAMVPVFPQDQGSIFRFGPEDEPDGIGVQGGFALLAHA